MPLQSLRRINHQGNSHVQPSFSSLRPALETALLHFKVKLIFFFFGKIINVLTQHGKGTLFFLYEESPPYNLSAGWWPTGGSAQAADLRVQWWKWEDAILFVSDFLSWLIPISAYNLALLIWSYGQFSVPLSLQTSLFHNLALPSALSLPRPPMLAAHISR